MLGDGGCGVRRKGVWGVEDGVEGWDGGKGEGKGDGEWWGRNGEVGGGVCLDCCCICIFWDGW